MSASMPRAERIAAIASGYVEAEAFAGIEWLVHAKGKELARGGVGYDDADAGSPLPDGAIYRIFSMTKPVVSLLALQLVEAGQLRLYDMVVQYDQRFGGLRVLETTGALGPVARPLTVEDLLTHRAGFTYEFIHGCHIAQYYREAEITHDGQCSLEEMMSRLVEIPLAFQPGSRFRYSVSIDVLAHVIERATDRSLDELLKAYIFDPLGMEDTAFAVPEDKQHRLLTMYGAGDLSGLPPLEVAPQRLDRLDVDRMYPINKPDTFRRGGLGLYSTLEDYGRFAAMLLTGRSADGQILISRKMMEMLRTNRIPRAQLPLAIGPNVLHGFGWGLIGRVYLDSGAGLTLSGEGEFGWAGAAGTFFWVDPREDMYGVVMTQYMGASVPLADDMRTAAYQALE